MSQVLARVNKVLVSQDDLPADVISSLISDIVSGKEIDYNIIDRVVTIYKMKDLTDAQKKEFVNFFKTHPFAIYAHEQFKKTEGDTITFVINNSYATVTITYKIANKERYRHGESVYEYTSGRKAVETWSNNKIQHSIIKSGGLTTYTKYDENHDVIETTFGQFEHLPNALDITEQTPFMKFQQTLIERLSDPAIIKAKQLYLPNIQNYDLFSDWTTEFAKSNGYKLTNWDRDLTW